MNNTPTIYVRAMRIGPIEMPLPRYATDGSAGADLHAALQAPVTIPSRGGLVIPTGFAFEIPPGWEGQVRPRSGLAIRHGVTVINAPGTIDSDYRGEVMVPLFNHGASAFTVNPLDRIAQIVFAPHAHAILLASVELADTARGAGGFGSTGI